jgi:geranylgeranyl diphosphate synthase type II
LSDRHFQKLYSSYKSAVERKLDRCPGSGTPKSIEKPLRYVLSGGGKRVRAVLTLASCEAVGGAMNDALDAATAIEILHNFTLVHDDVMDHANLRRGKPTVHKKWDTNVAILTGDELVAYAYASLLTTQSPRISSIMKVFTDGFIQVCEGQALDKEFEHRSRITLDEYFLMIGKKTGRIIAAATEIGALIGSGVKKHTTALRNFGIHLGRAFQVQDDLLDIVADEKEFGKIIGGDLREGKKTYLLVKALETTSGTDHALLRSVTPHNGITKNDITRIREIYGKSGAIDAAKREIALSTRRAKRALALVPASEAKEMLCWFADELLERNS